jgi:ubiquinone/menaquinone biosynthesis C-methylase UbiE
MASPEIDPAEFRNAQKESWGDAAAGWKKWSGWLDDHSLPVSARLVALAGVESGSHVLDVAAGYGEPSLTAARKAGPDGRVVSTDIAAEMLAFGRERAAAAGMENIEFLHSGANDLDFPHESFDAAVSRWGIIFEPDGEGTAARIRGFLKPGARFAISSWGTPEQCPMIARPMKAAMDFLGLDPPPPGTPGPLSRPTPEAIGGLLQGGGFSEVQVEEMDLEFPWSSPEEFTTYVREVIAPITRLIEAQPADAQPKAWKAIEDDIRELAGDDGKLVLGNRVLLAAGQV